VHGSEDRRVKTENQLITFKEDDEHITRIEALIPTDQIVKEKKGKISPTEKAVYLSHAKAIRFAASRNEFSFIMEDDIEIFGHTFPILKKILQKIQGQKWDLIFTDLIPTTPNTTLYLYNIIKTKSLQRRAMLLPIGNETYAGATGYVINPNSIERLHNLIEENDELNIPFDILLRQLIRTKRIKAAVTIPFLSTVTLAANKSSNQPKSSLFTDELWNAARRTMALPNPEANRELEMQIESLTDDLSARDQLLGKLLAGYSSNKFVPK
jgi:GR25 family glycosyltransferase involved in LPS biosynthesis